MSAAARRLASWRIAATTSVLAFLYSPRAGSPQFCQPPLDVLGNRATRGSCPSSRSSAVVNGNRRCRDADAWMSSCMRWGPRATLRSIRASKASLGKGTQLREKRKDRRDVRLARGPVAATRENRLGPECVALKSLRRHPLLTFDGSCRRLDGLLLSSALDLDIRCSERCSPTPTWSAGTSLSPKRRTTSS